MSLWSITLHGASGILSAVDAGESQFVIGAETASDVFTVHGAGVMPRHAWVWISEAGLQVEDLGAGTLVNGYQITERVQVEYPASVQVGELTLVIEVKLVQPVQQASQAPRVKPVQPVQRASRVQPVKPAQQEQRVQPASRVQPAKRVHQEQTEQRVQQAR
jgi:hypothetical protein